MRLLEDEHVGLLLFILSQLPFTCHIVREHSQRCVVIRYCCHDRVQVTFCKFRTSLTLDLCTSKTHVQDPFSHLLPAPQLQATLARFSLWLSSPEVVHSPRLSALSSPSLHSTIHHVALVRVAKAYAKLCEEVRKPDNRYEAASTLLGIERPFGQVGVLWAIFGLEEEDEESAD